MPWGRYPDQVGPFNKWAKDRVNKADINDKATGARRTGSKVWRTRRRRKRTKKE